MLLLAAKALVLHFPKLVMGLVGQVERLRIAVVQPVVIPLELVVAGCWQEGPAGPEREHSALPAIGSALMSPSPKSRLLPLQ